MRTTTIYIILLASLMSCSSPSTIKLFPMEQYLQGSWYRARCVTMNDSIIYSNDTISTIEIHTFKNHSWVQYYKQFDHVEKYTWSFIADDTAIYRSTDSTGQALKIGTRGDTLVLNRNPYYFLFCRYYSSALPNSWPDSLITCSQMGPPCFVNLQY
jgi:hypothetical protein